MDKWKSKSSFELSNDGVLLSTDQGFGMSSVAQIESNHEGFVRIHRLLTAGGSGLEISVFEIVHNNVFVVEVHWSSNTRGPSVIPNNETGVFEELPAAGPRECER